MVQIKREFKFPLLFFRGVPDHAADFLYTLGFGQCHLVFLVFIIFIKNTGLRNLGFFLYFMI